MASHLETRSDGSTGRGLQRLSRATNTRLLCLLVWIALFVVILLAYAGPAAPVAIYRLLTDGALLAAWLVSAAGFGVWVLRVLPVCDDAPRTLPAPSPNSDAAVEPLAVSRGTAPCGLLHVVTAIALGLGILSLLVLALGLLGRMSGAAAFVLLAVGWALAFPDVVRHFRRMRGTAPTLAPSSWFLAPAGWGWLWLLAAPPLALAVVAAFVPPGILWSPQEPHGYDVVEYHLQVPREWYEAGRIYPLQHNAFSYFPFNVEMHYLLAMYLRGGPWAGMYLAQLMHLAMLVLTVLAVYGFARMEAPSRASALVATLAVATTPWFMLLGPIAYNEGGMLLFGTLSIGWAMRAALHPRRRLGRFPVAGLLAGFACGAKLTAVPEVLLAVAAVCAAAAVLLRPRDERATDEQVPLSHRLIGVVIFLVCGVASFSPWLIRNFAWVRNPVFPEAAALFGRAHFSAEQVERWRRAHSPIATQRALPARLAAVGSQIVFDWRFGYVLLPLALASIALAPHRRAVLFLAALLALHALFWLGFTHLQGRFFILAVPIAGLMLAQAHWGRWAVVPAVLVTLAMTAGFVRAQGRLADYLNGKELTQALGRVHLQEFLAPDALRLVPPGARLTLAGDAKVFWYQMPMSQIRYRTVFDVDAGRFDNIVQAWAGRPIPLDDPGLIVDPGELARFHETYSTPPLSPALERAAPRDPRLGVPIPFIPRMLPGSRPATRAK